MLGDLPPAKQQDAGTDGGGGAGTTATTATTGSAGSAGSAGGTGGAGCCDCDHDGHEAMGACGGDDCDDSNAKVYPGEPNYYPTPANATIGFDWNCNGTIERNPTLNVAINCGSLPPCPAGTGYLGAVAPECGASADWGTCKPSGVANLSCVKDVVVQQVMTCR